MALNLIDEYVEYLHSKLNEYWLEQGGWDMDIIVNQDYVYADNEHPISCVVRALTGSYSNGLCELPIQLLFDVIDVQGINDESLYNSFKKAVEKLLNDIRETSVKLGDVEIIQDYDSLVLLSSYEDAGFNLKNSATVNAKLQFHIDDDVELLTLGDVVITIDDVVINPDCIQSFGFKETITTEAVGSAFSQENIATGSTSAITMSFSVDKTDSKHIDLISKGSYRHSLQVNIGDGLLLIEYQVAIRANLEYMLVPGAPCVATISMIEGGK